jgi:flagellar motility protein MotE (MotC chaperone)
MRFRFTSTRLGRRRPGALFLMAAFLGLSGLLKLGIGLGTAMANTVEPADAPAPQTCELDGGTMAMLSALQEREARLAEQEKLAADQQTSIGLARTEIDRKLAELADAEAKLAATITQADQAADKDISALVAMYESMKPKDAAKLFAEMDHDFAAGFLARMRPESAAGVLAGLDPPKAYAISVLLAGRNANAPKS